MRLIRKDPKTKCASVSQVSLKEFAETVGQARQEPSTMPSATTLKMQQALLPSLNEMFFTRVLVLVEGLEDIAYITAYLHLLDLWEEFRRHGCHLVSADNKSHILQPLAVATRLQIPTFVVFDSDAEKKDRNGSRTKHEKDNKAILRLRGYADQSALPAETFWANDTVMWHSDIGTVVQGELGEGFQKILEEERSGYGSIGGIDKTALFISGVLAKAWQNGLRSPSLERLSQRILDFAKKTGLA